jgi:hypothetical protein
MERLLHAGVRLARVSVSALVLMLLVAGCGSGSTTKKYCSELVALQAKSPKPTPYLESTSANIEARARVFEAAANAAPPEIHADFETFAGAFKTFARTFARLHRTSHKFPTFTQFQEIEGAAKALDASKVQAAKKHVANWAAKNCGGVFATTSG